MTLSTGHHQELGLNDAGDWTVLVARDQLHWGREINGCALDGFALGGFISVFGWPHGYCLLADFVGLERAEAVFIKKKVFMGCSATTE